MACVPEDLFIYLFILWLTFKTIWDVAKILVLVLYNNYTPSHRHV